MDVYLRFWIILLILNFIYHTLTHVPYQTRGGRVWMVTDGKNNWVEGRLNAQGVAMTYEEIILEEEWNKQL